MLIFVATWWTSTGAWACDAPQPAAELSEELVEASQAFLSLEPDRFAAAMANIDQVLPCLGEVAPPRVVADLHRLKGVAAFLGDDRGGMVLELLAARTLDPSLTLFPGLLPEGHELRHAWESTSPTPPRTEAVPGARDGQLVFDGQPSTWRPTDRPTLFQVVDGDGVALQSAYLTVGDRLPPYRVYAPTRTSLAITSGVLAAASVGFLGGGIATYDRFQQTTAIDSLGSLQGTNQALTSTSIALATGAIATGIAAALVGRR